MGPHAHVLKSLMPPGVRAAGYEVAAYHQLQSTVSSRDIVAPGIAEMYPVL